MSIRQRLLRGFGASFVSQGVNAATQFLGIPIFLSALGTEQYGEWLMVSAISAAIAMSDVGVASAATNAMTVYIGAGQRELAQKMFRNSWLLLSILSSVIGVFLLLFIWFSPFVIWLNFKSSGNLYIQLTIAILVVQTLISLQTTMLLSSLRSVGHLAMSVNIATVERLLEFVLQVLVVWYFRSLLALAIAGLVARFVEYGIARVIQGKIAGWMNARQPNSQYLIDRTIFRPALSSMAFPIGQALGNQAIIFVIGRQLGATAVAVFAAHRTLSSIAHQLAQIVSHTMLPEFSLALGAGDFALAKRLHRRSCQISMSLGLTCCLLIGFASTPLLYLLTRGQIELNSNLMSVLLIWIATRSLWYASLFVPFSINRHHRIAAAYVLGTLISLVIAVPMTHAWGLTGTAIALISTDLLMLFLVLRTSLAIVGDSTRSFLGFMVGHGS